MEGYKEAEKHNLLINMLAKEYPIEDNEREWLNFTRTVTSSLEILKALALRSLEDAKPENIEP